MQEEFIPGQRWMSEAEPDLGLGMVMEADGRIVKIAFAASDEQRAYAVDNAPLARVRFDIGARVEDQNDTPLVITEVLDNNGCLIYQCETESGEQAVVPEQVLSDRIRLNRPQDKLLSQRLDADTWFSLRYQTWLKNAELWRSDVFGLAGPRVSLIPHQMYIAAEVASRANPRVLLADEVGLGKTIEAGLIMHKLMMAERVKRALIVVPDALVYQWLVEMLRRFNLRFSVFDEERFAESDGDNPFLSEQRVLCSLQFLTSKPEVARASLKGEWDLLVVDEAHHLEWAEDGASLEYELIDALAAEASSVLLLTATPEQLGRAGHFARLRLLDPVRFHDYGDFLEEEQRYEPVAQLSAKLLDDKKLTKADEKVLEQLLDGEVSDDEEEIVRQLVDRHGTGRVLFRNTRHAIKGFPGRQLLSHSLDIPEGYSVAESSHTPEVGFGSQWLTLDPRVQWLSGLLKEIAPDKVLIICANADSVVELRDYLLEKQAVHVAMFHEGMEIVERDRAAAFFADDEKGAQALICSEIGSEGRNFQFAHHLVLFDLPIEPDLLEQRIGRLDRIGQTETIKIHSPYFKGGVSEILHDWYNEGLSAFESICPAASTVFSHMADELLETLKTREGVDQLIVEAAKLTASINADLEAGRDRLLELNSHHPEESEALRRQLDEDADTKSLEDYMVRYWDTFGVEHELGPGRSLVLRPGHHMLYDTYPNLSSEGATITFDRSDALAHENREFLTWEHPMVRGSMELLTTGELGGAAVTVSSHPDYKTGTMLLELLYVTECAAPRALEPDRYLPPTCIRLLLDVKGNNLAAKLDHDKLQGLCLTQNKKLAQKVIKSQSKKLKLLFQLGDQLSEKQIKGITEQAVSRMNNELDDEFARMIALAEVNPNVTAEELEHIQIRKEVLSTHLAETRVRLDAARVVVMR